MKINKYQTVKNKSKNLRLYFSSPGPNGTRRSHFRISFGPSELYLDGREARMLHSFLKKIYG